MNNILETKGKKFLKLFLLALVTILTVNIGGAFLVTAKAATNDTKTTKEMEQTSSASTYSMVDKKSASDSLLTKDKATFTYALVIFVSVLVMVIIVSAFYKKKM